MPNSIHQRIIHGIRVITPLHLRKNVGPYVGFAVYFFNVNFRKNRQVPQVLSLNETLDLIKEKKLSAIRFGDGEISFIDNLDLGFQERNKDLADKLAAVLQVNDEKLLICIPGIWKRLEGFTPLGFWFNIHQLFRHGHVWRNLLSYGQVYGDAYITRPYLGYKDKSDSGNIFKKLFSLWEGSEVVLIEGEKSRLGVGNDMFDNVKSIERILCPPENAYAKYEEIKRAALQVSKDKLILLSLGPTAKVLAYEMFKQGYRVLDIGHIDMEYEMFLRQETHLVKVKYKYYNKNRERNPEDCQGAVYKRQIIARIK